MSRQSSFSALISGRVQGVAYRYFIREKARNKGIKGHVRNLPDGCVEVVALGHKGALEALITDLKKGPPASRVEEVQIEWGECRSLYDNFTIRY